VALDDFAVALRCSDLAAVLALKYFESGVKATTKADGSPVTEADRAVERLLQEELRLAFPIDSTLGEESGAAGETERVWILDPIDGTSFFSEGSPHWRVHVVLTIAGRPEIAVVTAPAIGLQWWARRGHGAFESVWPRTGEEKRLVVRATEKMSDAILVSDMLDGHNAFDANGKSSTGWCDGLIQIVRGEVDGFLCEGHQVWDQAPWILLVEEAGGLFTKRSPAELHGGGLYSNGALHRELLEVIGYAVTPL
jgi:histidinol-phosphatase